MALATAPGLAASVPMRELTAVVDPYALFCRCRTPPVAPPALDPAPTSAATAPDLAAREILGTPALRPPRGPHHSTVNHKDRNGGRRRQARDSQSPQPLSRKRRCTTSPRESGFECDGSSWGLHAAPLDVLVDKGEDLDSDNKTDAPDTNFGADAPGEGGQEDSNLENSERVPFLRWRMRNSWFCFPREIRDQIYNELLRPPSSYELYAGYYAAMASNRPDCGADADAARGGCGPAGPGRGRGRRARPTKPGVRLRTPSILVVCSAITEECRPVLDRRTLVIDRIPPWPAGARAPLPVSHFVGRATLRRLRSLEIRVELGRGVVGSGWAWNPLVRDILDVLGGGHNSLQRLRVVVKLFGLGNVPMYAASYREGGEWSKLLARLEAFRETNPMIWKPPLIEIEYWEICKGGVFLRGHPESPLYFLDPRLLSWPWHGKPRTRRIGDATDSKLVPGSVTESFFGTIGG